jgi:DNA-binding transcriptional LysR family regulator
VLARWASALLVIGGLSTILIPLLPNSLHPLVAVEVSPAVHGHSDAIRVASPDEVAAVEGLGIALLPVDMVSSALENGRLIEIRVAGWRCELREMFAVYPATRILSPKVRALIDFTLEKNQTT